MRPSNTYIHGTTPPEQDRLARLNDLLNERHLRELGLRSGERVLDLGAGLGQLARAMARIVGPTGSVIGIEQSSEQLAEATRRAAASGDAAEGSLELRLGSAEEPPLAQEEWGSFDVAHARFILEHVRDPLCLVQQMVRAVRPGGRVVLADDDHEAMQLWPEPPGFYALWRAYCRTYDRCGNDPIVGRRLVALLHEAGATPARNALVFFGACSGEATFPAYVANIIGIFEGAREAILASQHVDADEFAAAIGALQRWSARPDAAIWFYVSYAEGRVGG